MAAYTTRVLVFSAPRKFLSVVHITMFDFPTHAAAVEFARDEDRSLRQTYEYVWTNASIFYRANILAVVVEANGATLIGFRHFCLTDDEVAKECKDRSIDLEKAMAERAVEREKTPAVSLHSVWSS
jgi:hypothetical protein